METEFSIPDAVSGGIHECALQQLPCGELILRHVSAREIALYSTTYSNSSPPRQRSIIPGFISRYAANVASLNLRCPPSQDPLPRIVHERCCSLQDRAIHRLLALLAHYYSIISRCQRSFHVSIGLDEASCHGAGGASPSECVLSAAPIPGIEMIVQEKLRSL